MYTIVCRSTFVNFLFAIKSKSFKIQMDVLLFKRIQPEMNILVSDA